MGADAKVNTPDPFAVVMAAIDTYVSQRTLAVIAEPWEAQSQRGNLEGTVRHALTRAAANHASLQERIAELEEALREIASTQRIEYEPVRVIANAALRSASLETP